MKMYSCAKFKKKKKKKKKTCYHHLRSLHLNAIAQYIFRTSITLDNVNAKYGETFT